MVILGLLMFGLGSSLWADREPIDRIVAIVDSDVVLESELKERLRSVKNQYAGSDQELPPSDILSKQILERLVIDSIQLQMGERGGIRIGDEDLTSAILNIAKRNRVTLEEFQKELADKGISYRSFREEIRRSMIIQEVQRHQLGNRIRITPKELGNFLASPIGQELTADEYLLGHILISVSGRASAQAIYRAEEKAKRLYEQLQEGDSFKDLAIMHSDGGRAAEGGNLGWRRADKLPSMFAKAAVKMSVGDTLEPIRSGSGFHLISLLDKRGAGTETEKQSKVRHILVRTSEIRSEKDAKDLIHEIKTKLLAGEDFDTLARLHSSDPGSALAGGELGWISNENLAPEFAAQMESATVGEISEPFQTEFGWHVLQVEERRIHDISQEQRERKAMEYLRNRRFEEEFEDFLTEIRNEAYVELK